MLLSVLLVLVLRVQTPLSDDTFVLKQLYYKASLISNYSIVQTGRTVYLDTWEYVVVECINNYLYTPKLSLHIIYGINTAVVWQYIGYCISTE